MPKFQEVWCTQTTRSKVNSSQLTTQHVTHIHTESTSLSRIRHWTSRIQVNRNLQRMRNLRQKCVSKRNLRWCCCRVKAVEYAMCLFRWTNIRLHICLLFTRNISTSHMNPFLSLINYWGEFVEPTLDPWCQDFPPHLVGVCFPFFWDTRPQTSQAQPSRSHRFYLCVCVFPEVVTPWAFFWGFIIGF